MFCCLSLSLKMTACIEKAGAYGVTQSFRPHYTLAFRFWVPVSSHLSCACDDGLASDILMIHLVLYKASELATATTLHVRFSFGLALREGSLVIRPPLSQFPPNSCDPSLALRFEGITGQTVWGKLWCNLCEFSPTLSKWILVVEGQMSHLTILRSVPRECFAGKASHMVHIKTH